MRGEGLAFGCAVEIATQYVEGSVELAITGYTESQRHAEYPLNTESSLTRGLIFASPLLRRRTVPRITTEGAATWKGLVIGSVRARRWPRTL